MSSVRPVPLCDLQPQYQQLKDEIQAAVNRVLASGQVILGPEVAALEREVAAYCGVGYAVGCGSGTDALSLALHGLSIGPGDEVIMPPFTFFATAGSVLRCGATPVFVDIELDSFNMDVALVSRAITPRTKAIMPVHLYGQCADMAELWRIGEQFGIPIIEDACQSFGATYQGKRCGTLGAMACFSFYPTKNLGTYGDAGMVVTNDPDWAERMMTLRVHGMKPKYHHGMLGWNARIDAVQAAMLASEIAARRPLDRGAGGGSQSLRFADWIVSIGEFDAAAGQEAQSAALIQSIRREDRRRPAR